MGLSDIANGVLGFEGQRRTNSAMHDMSQEQMRFQERVGVASQQKDMDFQERMSNTQYQRQTQDLAAAGLNPMLGYMKGSGGSTPSGASFSPSGSQPTGIRSPAGAGFEAASQAAQMKVNSAMAAKVTSEKDLVEAQIPGAVAEARLKNASADASIWQLEHMFPSLKRSAEGRASVDMYEGELAAMKEMPEVIRDRVQSERRRGVAEAGLAEEELRQRGKMNPQELRRAIGEALHLELDLPRARAESGAHEGTYGQRVRPYLGDLSKVVGSAASALGAGSAVKYLLSKPYKGVMSKDIKGTPLVDKSTGEIHDIKKYRRQYGR